MNISKAALFKRQWLFNHSLSMGYFANKFKIALIKLRGKPDTDHTNPINYMPMSLLEVTGKIFEKIVVRRLRIDRETHGNLVSTDHGSRYQGGTDSNNNHPQNNRTPYGM